MYSGLILWEKTFKKLPQISGCCSIQDDLGRKILLWITTEPQNPHMISYTTQPAMQYQHTTKAWSKHCMLICIPVPPTAVSWISLGQGKRLNVMSSCVGMATGHMTSWQSADSWYQCQVSCSSCQRGLSTSQSQWVRSNHIWLTIWIEWVKFCIYLCYTEVGLLSLYHPLVAFILSQWVCLEFENMVFIYVMLSWSSSSPATNGWSRAVHGTCWD